MNVIVDPYRVFRIVDAAGFNARKPRAMEQGYLSKLAAVTALRPERLIVGNSRAEVGFDPASPAWGDTLVTYNAALPGTGPATSLEFMQIARAHGRLKEAIVGLDFLDFLVGASPAGSARSNPVPMVADPRSRPTQRPRLDLATRLMLVVSLDAFQDSIRTVATQHIDTLPDLAADGFNPMRDYAAMARRDGYGAFFRQRDQENAAAYVRGPKSIFEAEGRTSSGWRALDEMVSLCNRLDRGCTFIVYPYHAHTLQLFEMTGLAVPFRAWKAELVRRLEPLSKSGTSADLPARTRLWDFSGYNSFAREPVPALNDRRTKVRWYWEAGHFKRDLGDLMIARIRGWSDVEFGLRLDALTLPDEERRMRIDADRYATEHPADVTELRALVDTVSSKR